MPDSGDETSRKCLSGFLNRLLCSGGLPTHPSEQLIESSIKKLDFQEPEKSSKPEENYIKEVAAVAAGGGPGIVARLMGLDSFPSTHLPPKQKTLGDFFRSRSVNSIDFLSHFDPVKHGHLKHRRVRTSVSFREGINDDFTSRISRVDEGNEAEEIEEKVKYQFQQGKKEREIRRKNREIFQERKVCNRPGKNREIFQGRESSNRPCKNLEMERKRKSVPGKVSTPGNSANQKKDFQGKMRLNLKEKRPIIKAVNCKEELMEAKCVKKKNKILAHKKHCVKKIHPESSVPEVARERSSRKQLLSQTDTREVREITRRQNERKVKIKESCYYTRMVEEVCMVTEADVKENWIHGIVLKFEDFEEIYQEFGQEILEVLLEQFVEELVLLSGTRNN